MITGPGSERSKLFMFDFSKLVTILIFVSTQNMVIRKDEEKLGHLNQNLAFILGYSMAEFPVRKKSYRKLGRTFPSYSLCRI